MSVQHAEVPFPLMTTTQLLHDVWCLYEYVFVGLTLFEVVVTRAYCMYTLLEHTVEGMEFLRAAHSDSRPFFKLWTAGGPC